MEPTPKILIVVAEPIPAPVVHERALKTIRNLREQADKRIAKFKQEFEEKSPAHALEWHAEILFYTESLREYAGILEALTQNQEGDKLAGALKDCMDHLVHDAVRLPVRMGSTSRMANTKELQETQARSEFVRELGQIIGDFRFL